MSTFVLAVLGIVVAIFWGIAINYHTAGDYENVRRAFWWLIPALLVTSAVTLIAYWSFVVEPARNSQGSELKRPTFREKVEKVTFRVGNNYITVDYQQLEKQSLNLVHLGEGRHMTARIHENKPVVDVEIYSGDGNPSIIFKDNEFTKPPSWDSNSNDWALEIINERQEPVLQVIYESPTQIGINGIFRTAKGRPFIMTDQGIGLDSPDEMKYLKPIFKYPSWKYPGQFVEVSQSQQLDAAISLLKTTGAPNVCIENTFITLAPNRSPQATLHLINNGLDTAIDFTTRTFCTWKPSDFAGPLNHAVGNADDIQPTIRRGEKITVDMVWANLSMTAPTLALIEAGTLLLFIYLETSYKDTKGTPYHDRQCFLYQPRVSNLIIAPKRYWPKS